MRAKGTSPTPSAFPFFLLTRPHSGASCSPAARGSHPRSSHALGGTGEGAGGGWCLPPAQGPLRDPAKWPHPARLGREYPPPWSRVEIFTGGSNLQSPLGGRWGGLLPALPLINVLPIWESRLCTHPPPLRKAQASWGPEGAGRPPGFLVQSSSSLSPRPPEPA